MHWRGWLISAIAIAGAVHATASLAQSPIGSAASAQNQVEGIIGGGTQRIVAGTALFLNERVRTGDESQAQLVFLDETNLGVGPKSEVTLSRFVYNPDRGTGRVAIEASRGVFRFVTGSQDKKNYEVNTPIATIQVKGTEFHILVEEKYIVVALVHGALRIVTVRGRVVWHDQPGTRVTVHADGRVDGPMPWTAPFTRYAGDVPFPYFASKPAQASRTLRPAGSLSRLKRPFSPFLGGSSGAVSRTGLYVGGNVGYSWGRGNSNYTDPGFPAGVPTSFSGSQKIDGAIGGVQIGYNGQTNENWVFGLEADFQRSGEQGDSSFSTLYLRPSLPSMPPSMGSLINETDSKVLWFGTVRGRAGVLVTPSLLLYGTGGLAYGRISASGTVTDTISSLSWSYAGSTTNIGWTLGAGVEGVIPNMGDWIWKLEYLYIDLGSVYGNGHDPDFNSTFSWSAKVTDNIIRVGLNYRFH